jgi:hypothetical protein
MKNLPFSIVPRRLHCSLWLFRNPRATEILVSANRQASSLPPHAIEEMTNVMTFKLHAALCLVVLLALTARGQDEAKAAKKRFGFDFNPLLYPQDGPEKTVQSIVKALDAKRYDYLLAQIADPKYIDQKVAEYKDLFPKKADEQARAFLAFDRLVRETATHFSEDPLLLKELRQFAQKDKAMWEEKEDRVVGSVDSIAAHKVFLRKIGDRWFLENKQQ